MKTKFVASGELSSILIIILLLTQVGLSASIALRLRDIGQIAVGPGPTEPDVPRYVENVSVGNSPALGPEDAPVIIVEFSDYECPFCAQAAPYVKRILEEYPDEVRFVLRDFPLENIHPNAFKAAEAAHCAGDQDKFWEMHDILFANQGQLDLLNLKDLAVQLEMDSDQFNKCLVNGKYTERVRNDIADAHDYQVRATPTFFINGRRLEGPTFEQLRQEINAALEAR